MTTFRSRKGNEMKRKQLTIIDNTNNVGALGQCEAQTINFTLFGDNAMVTDDRLVNHPVIAIKVAVPARREA